MDRLKWCFNQRNGIKIIKPNKNVASSYLERAKSDYQVLNNQNKVWKVIISYYVCYNGFYSVLAAYGIKSEIHSCTLALLSYFPRLKKYHDFMKQLKINRTNTQYYLKEPEQVEQNKIKEFLDLCELEIYEINQKKIMDLRKKLENN
ncbi:MAG: hypothetical protein MAG795_01265 [Candidatus Woesearchaeota archaeon]|nr:hypothetical protein [Candidatus Woesearchaeota archaeon]